MYVPRPSPHSLAVLSCPAESYQSYEWPLTPEGTLASLSCELGYAGAITRMCLVGGTWNTTVDNTCTQHFNPAGRALSTATGTSPSPA